MKNIMLIAVLALILINCKVVQTDDSNEDNSPPVLKIYYVSNDGSNSNNGSIDSPWETIQYGLDSLKPGEKLLIKKGKYSETLHFSGIGTQDQMYFIEGESNTETILSGEKAERDLVFLEGSEYVKISNITIQNAPRSGIRLSYSHHIEIQKCRIINNGRWGVFTDFSDFTLVENSVISGSEEEHGVYISNSSDFAVIRNNQVHHNYAAGIQVNADPSMGGDGISSDCVIEGNLVFENGKAGGAAINLASVRDSRIQNNILYNNYAGGIAVWDDGQGVQWGSKNLEIFHNTVYFRGTEGRWAVSLKNGSSGGKIINNILCGGRRGGLEIDKGSLISAEINGNIYFRFGSDAVVSIDEDGEFTLSEWKTKGYDEFSYKESPQSLFVSIAGNNYHLRVNARAVDSALDSDLDVDFEGDSRPQDKASDIGADEII